MPKSTRKKKEVKQEALCSLTLTINGVEYKGQGATFEEALHNLPKPDKTLNKGVLHIKKGEKERVMFLWPLRMRRLFFPIAQRYMARGFEIGL